MGFRQSKARARFLSSSSQLLLLSNVPTTLFRMPIFLVDWRPGDMSPWKAHSTARGGAWVLMWVFWHCRQAQVLTLFHIVHDFVISNKWIIGRIILQFARCQKQLSKFYCRWFISLTWAREFRRFDWLCTKIHDFPITYLGQENQTIEAGN